MFRELVGRSVLSPSLFYYITSGQVFTSGRSYGTTVNELVSIVFVRGYLGLYLGYLYVRYFHFRGDLLQVGANDRTVVLAYSSRFTCRQVRDRLVLGLLQECVFAVKRGSRILRASVSGRVAIFVRVSLIANVRPTVLWDLYYLVERLVVSLRGATSLCRGLAIFRSSFYVFG